MPFCPLCSNIDFAAISRRSVDNLFRLSETTYPDHSLFSYTSLDVNLHQTENNLTAHYDSLMLLCTNAKSCELCYLIRSSIDTFLMGFQSRKKLGYNGRIPDYELWLGGRVDSNGFQILGLEKGVTRRRLFYSLMGGVGFCIHDGEHNKLRLLITGLNG